MTTATPTLPLTDLSALHEPIRVDLERAFARVLRDSQFTNGPDVEAFEDELGAFLSAPYVVGVASGTAALTLMLTAAGIGRGDEVILPPNTFFATAEAVVASGARPVLADVDPDTALLDPKAVDAAVIRLTDGPAVVSRIADAELSESRWRVRNLVRESSRIAFEAEGYGPGEFDWRVPAGTTCQVTARRDKAELWTDSAQAGESGSLTFTVPVSAVVPMTIEIDACRRRGKA